ncbi:MAG TPA: hypothetical protein VGJ75_02290 [Dongiaceae bacterium]|jgi:hypothetical protein
MPRGVRIALWTLGAVGSLWLGYTSIAEAVRDGVSVEGILLAPSNAALFILAPVCLAQLYRYLMAERKENVLNPQIALTASEPAIARFLLGFMAFGFVTSGIAGFWDRSVLVYQPTPLYLSILYIAAGIMIGLGALVAPRMYLRLFPDGLEYSHVRPFRIQWQDIADVTVRRMLLSHWIVVTLRNTAEFRSTSWFARWRKVQTILIYPSLFGLEAEMLKEGIDIRRNVSAF